MHCLGHQKHAGAAEEQVMLLSMFTLQSRRVESILAEAFSDFSPSFAGHFQHQPK